MPLNILRIETAAERYDEGSTADFHITALADGSVASGEVEVTIDGETAETLQHRSYSDGETANLNGEARLPSESGRYEVAAGDASTTVTVGEPPSRPLTAERTVDGDSVSVTAEVPEERSGASFIERFDPPLSERPDIVRKPSGSSVIVIPAKKGIIVAVRDAGGRTLQLEYTVNRDDEDHVVDFFVGDSESDNITGDTVIRARKRRDRFEDMTREELVQILLELMSSEN